MSENEPHVSTDELRAALAPQAELRRNPVLVSDHSEQAAAEVQELRAALDGARADAIELRAALDASRGDAAELRAELAAVRAESRERRVALDQLARAGLFRRGRVVRELNGRGVL
jgi:septal ring factor EnvC (AmiA/AmiB activator)